MVKLFSIAVLLAAVCGQAVEPPSIQTMSDRGKLIKVTGIRQLTFKGDPKPNDSSTPSYWLSPDGKYAAYFGAVDGHSSYSIVSTSGGKSATLLGSPKQDPSTGQICVDTPVWGVSSDLPILEWSPDSRLIALPAILYTPGSDGASATRSKYVLVLNPKGEIKASFVIGEDEVVPRLLWSPDGKYVAAQILSTSWGERSEGSTPKASLKERIDVFNWASKAVSYSVELRENPRRIKWKGTNDGFDIEYRRITEWNTLAVSVEEVDFSGKVLKTRTPEHFSGIPSPDGEYLATSSRSGLLEIQLVSTGKALRTVTAPGAEFAGWMPDSRMFFYTVPTNVTDENKGRTANIRQLWMATVEANKLNHMCVSVASDYSAYGSNWSSAGAKVAYWSTGGLTVADLETSDIGTPEKVALGLPLTENEEKTLLINQGKQIGIALEQYAMDNKGALPATEAGKNDLIQFCRSRDIFCRPGTDTDIFTYYPQPKLTDIEHPSDTIIGMFDAGYSWKICIYADGHVKTVAKDQTP